MLPKIAILADLSHEIMAESLEDSAILMYELITSLVESQKNIGGIELHLFARSNSQCNLPTYFLEADTFDGKQGDLVPSTQQEAVYKELFFANLLQDYHIIHCLAPILDPLTSLAHNGAYIIRTPFIENSHLVSSLKYDLHFSNFRSLHVGPYILGRSVYSIAPSVDLKRYSLNTKVEKFIACLGDEQSELWDQALRVANALGLPLKNLNSGDPNKLISRACLFLHLAPNPTLATYCWPIRAFSCGTPVAGWNSEEISSIFLRPELGVLSDFGQINDLVEKIKVFFQMNFSRRVPREFALAMFNRRSLAARCRHVYQEILLSHK